MPWNVIKILRIFDVMFYFGKVSGFESDEAINDENKKEWKWEMNFIANTVSSFRLYPGIETIFTQNLIRIWAIEKIQKNQK